VLRLLTAQINSERARKAYRNAASRFAERCDGRSAGELTDVQPFHVGGEAA
jgi:hypothetical protein